MKRRSEKKSKSKNFVFLRFFQEHKKIATCLILAFVFLGSFFVVNYGRYVKDVIEVYYLRTKNFYFTSDKLTINEKKYEIKPWGGTSDYELSISMSSLLNSLKGTNSNISYSLSCETDGKVDCFFEIPGTTEVERTIATETHSDNFVVTVSPKNGVRLKDGDKISVKVVANSISPYKEKLSANFILIVGNYGINYEIEDKVGNIYFDSIVTNTLDTTKAKVTLTITDPSVVIDMSNNILNVGTTTITEAMEKDYKDSNNDGILDSDATEHVYVKSVTFILEPKSSLMVRFYKKIPSRNYSYVNGDGTQPIVSFSRELIE